MPDANVLEGLIDQKLQRILQLFLRKKDELFHLQKISKEAHVPLTTTHALMKRLIAMEFISFITVGKFKLYKLAGNQKTKALEKLLHGK